MVRMDLMIRPFLPIILPIESEGAVISRMVVLLTWFCSNLISVSGKIELKM